VKTAADHKIEADDSFAQRLRLALRGESVHAFAQRCGIGDSTMRKYMQGSLPGLDTAVVIAKGAGVRLEWLATGEGPMAEGAAPADSPAETVKAAEGVDEDLLQAVVEGIELWLTRSKVTLGPQDKGRLVVLLYRIQARRRREEPLSAEALMTSPDIADILHAWASR
jgi:transcriptional regulator with XRE-family HTH domain